MVLPLSELTVPPPDLTILAKRNKAKFPADYVTRVFDERSESGPWNRRNARMGTVIFGIKC